MSVGEVAELFCVLFYGQLYDLNKLAVALLVTVSSFQWE